MAETEKNLLATKMKGGVFEIQVEKKRSYKDKK